MPVDSGAIATYVIGGAALGSSLLTLAFFLGRLTNRVDSLERWRIATESQNDRLFEEFRRIERLIKGEPA